MDMQLIVTYMGICSCDILH